MRSRSMLNCPQRAQEEAASSLSCDKGGTRGERKPGTGSALGPVRCWILKQHHIRARIVCGHRHRARRTLSYAQFFLAQIRNSLFPSEPNIGEGMVAPC